MAGQYPIGVICSTIAGVASAVFLMTLRMAIFLETQT